MSEREREKEKKGSGANTSIYLSICEGARVLRAKLGLPCLSQTDQPSSLNCRDACQPASPLARSFGLGRVSKCLGAGPILTWAGSGQAYELILTACNVTRGKKKESWRL